MCQKQYEKKIIEVWMPERAPETGIDEGTRKVRIYWDGWRRLWLCVEDMDWALQYLRDQLQHKEPGGVLCVD